MMLAEINSEYPNIQQMIDALGEQEKQFALLFLSMLDGDTVSAIEREMPKLTAAHESNDTEGIATILTMFGMDVSSVNAVLQTRENAINGV